MTPAEPYAVELVSVSWRPGNREDVFSGVSFSVKQGESVAICGARRVGKTTLLRLIARELPPRRGTVRLMGRDIWLMSPAETAEVLAVVPQEAASDFALTVRQVVSSTRTPFRGGPVPAAEVVRRADAALARVDLPDLADQPFAQLPGPVRQRVLIARALTDDPKILVLDNPGSPLDRADRQDLLRFLRGLGLTLVLSLDDPTLATACTDRVLHLSEGRHVEGRPQGRLSDDCATPGPWPRRRSGEAAGQRRRLPAPSVQG